jgi:hypothetical protein
MLEKPFATPNPVRAGFPCLEDDVKGTRRQPGPVRLDGALFFPWPLV